MPRMDGVVCTKAIKEQYPNTKIIILTTFDDDDFVFSALKYGASGYLLKGVGMDELYQSILTVYRGGGMINPDIATKVLGCFLKCHKIIILFKLMKQILMKLVNQNGKLYSKLVMVFQIKKLPKNYIYLKEQLEII